MRTLHPLIADAVAECIAFEPHRDDDEQDKPIRGARARDADESPPVYYGAYLAQVEAANRKIEAEAEKRAAWQRAYDRHDAWWRKLHRSRSVFGSKNGRIVCAFQSASEAAACGYGIASGIRNSVRKRQRYAGLHWTYEPVPVAVKQSRPPEVCKSCGRALHIGRGRWMAIVRKVCRELEVDICSVMGRDNTQSVSRCRQKCWAELRKTGLSLGGIARMFGKHHTTVLYGTRSVA